MFAFHRLRTPARIAAGVIGLFGLALSVSPARAAAPHYSDILPLSQVKPGMKGYGLTTFKGTTISRFEVTVIGIIKKQNEGHDLILIRMKGGPITERGANLIQGMSGSPIYLKGKVAGAFSQGEIFPKEPVGMVTPIEDMLDAWDPNIPQHPSYFQPAEKAAPQSARKPENVGDAWRPDRTERVAVLPHPITIGGRRLTRLILNARADDPRRSTADTAVLHPATNMLSVTGINARDRDWLQKELDKRGYALTVAAGAGGGGRSSTFKGVSLRPGSAFGTFLATGDIEFGATGTITYRRGNRVLAFGHPLMGLGALEAAITSASIVDIFSSLQISHHIATPGPVVGTLTQDRDFSVSAVLGRKPDMIPFEVAIRDETTHRTKTFHDYVFQHPDLTPLILYMIARDAISQVHDEPGDVMAHVTTSVDAAEVGRVTRSNLVFDANNISSPAVEDLTDITNIVSGNPFYPLPIKSAKMTVDITDGHNTATVERIFLKQGRYAPGDNLDVGVVLKPYRQDAVTRTITLKLPSDIPTGRYPLIVRGGTLPVMRFGGFTIAGGQQEPQAPPVNVRQMVARLNERETNTDLIARVVLNTVAPALEGEKLSQLPPNLSALMRSDRNSGVRLEREELRGTAPTDYVVSGTQQLIVTVVRKDSQEPSASGNTGGRSSTSGGRSPATALPGSPAGGVSAPDTEEDTQDAQPAPDDTDNALPNGLSDATATQSPVEPANLARWLAARAVDPPAKQNPPAKTEKKTGKKSGKAAAAKETPASDSTPASSDSAAATPAANTNSDKPVGRQLQVWRQTARADFANGKFDGTSVTAEGVLRLTPTLHRLVSTAETYIWSLAADPQGNLYAGTGTDGKILKIDPQGSVSTFATLPVVSVQSLLRDKDGTLWAGSGVKGNLYRIATDGKATLICALPEKYILALAEDSKGNLYIGPGGGGAIYKIAHSALAGSGPVTPEAYLKTPADHIMALTLDNKDNLYAGTGDDGILYRVTPDGKSSVLYDAKENAITTLAPDNQGNVYAGTGPKGMIYRVAPDGTATVVFDRAAGFFTAMQPAPDGTFYAATVNAIYHIVPSTGDSADAVVQAFDNPKDVDFLSLAVLPYGGIASGTGNIGEVYTAAPDSGAKAARNGTYESVVHDTHLLSRWGAIRWDAALPAGSQVRVETRTGDVAEPDATWSRWMPVVPFAGSATAGTVANPPSRFLQYRLILDAGQGTSGAAGPSVREVAVGYMPRNQAPKVTLQAPTGGERWAGSQTLRWTASDPDNDTLTYDLSYSSDGGTTWTPLPAAPNVKSTPPAKAPSIPPASLEDFRKRLDAQPNMPPSLKQAMLDGYQRMIAGRGGLGSLRDTSKSWDTKSLADGVYQLKIVASDHLSNPTDALTGEAVSDPFVICNALPQISLSTPQVMSTEKTIAVEGSVSQPLIAVTAVQYRIDGGEWIAAASKDGLFDSSQEGFAFVTLPLTSGKHTIEVEAFNAAGSKATQKADVTVP